MWTTEQVLILLLALWLFAGRAPLISGGGWFSILMIAGLVIAGLVLVGIFRVVNEKLGKFKYGRHVAVIILGTILSVLFSLPSL